MRMYKLMMINIHNLHDQKHGKQYVVAKIAVLVSLTKRLSH